MRRIAARIDEVVESQVHRVIAIDQISDSWTPDIRYLVLVNEKSEIEEVVKLRSAGLTNIGWIESADIEIDDVVVPQAKKSVAIVLYRANDLHHSLLMTNQCNSYCLMCSQPPTKQNDSWLVREAIDVIRHIRISPVVLGLSGGEPLLLGSALRTVIDEIHRNHPNTKIEVLTNGRLFSDRVIAKAVLDELGNYVSWLVPLYGHADFIHDFVVQSPGAFDETIAGLLVLQEHKQPVQLRIVLIEPVLQILDELSSFIGRNLAFIREVALMACEPIGFALANREHCEVDLNDWEAQLVAAAKIFRRAKIPYLFMNAPLCSLPKILWADSHKSISDWKNVYTEECEKCSVKESCSGLFSWHETGWKPAKVKAIEETIA
ncbi:MULTISPECIES: His-Xaa-Ser system radical SAM maturase HxsC [Oxalobacteraceae]|uniref:His-Xaa-Ser system radical SAM maturase HxsC n=1 Tax=Herminiimonas aquatilis TaxID=345342 RepID=A0ABW2J8P2_9BURK|nr:His-Xaa-Ser system radical SAM maturase HxsC [Janthinobacterium sp. Marseille]